jgi:RNA polymerase sigma factor (TIGR02999 family)
MERITVLLNGWARGDDAALERLTPHDRRRFYVLAARLIRMALVDQYRQTHADKHGGRHQRVPLHEDLAWVDVDSAELLSFEQALSELEQLDRDQVELFSLRFLVGCTAEETAELTGLSKATVDRKVKLARAWLFQRLRSVATDTGAPVLSARA